MFHYHLKEIIKKSKGSDENACMQNLSLYNAILKRRIVLSTKHSSMPLKEQKVKRDEKAFVRDENEIAAK